MNIWYNIIVASNRCRSYNVCETAILVFTSDEESEVKISDSDVDMPLSINETNSLHVTAVVIRKVKQPPEAVATL